MMRAGRFVFLTAPGAWLVGTFGFMLGTVQNYREDGWVIPLCFMSVLAGAVMLLLGTRTTDEPLFLLLFVPMPILISLGFHLGYLGMDSGFPIAVLGVAWPAITGPHISRYYKKRFGSNHSLTRKNFCGPLAGTE
jgi:hypothetical protein